mmetsp:Transcript_3233/g.7137  ORF Transcript_3233/g.7137 Transcript_3233/m.7137 type:complete len:375 (-) Transcript_3233:590-1714(-)
MEKQAKHGSTLLPEGSGMKPELPGTGRQLERVRPCPSRERNSDRIALVGEPESESPPSSEGVLLVRVDKRRAGGGACRAGARHLGRLGGDIVHGEGGRPRLRAHARPEVVGEALREGLPRLVHAQMPPRPRDELFVAAREAHLIISAYGGDVANVAHQVEPVRQVAPPGEVVAGLVRLGPEELRQQVVRVPPRLMLPEIVGDGADVAVHEEDAAQPVRHPDPAPPVVREVGVGLGGDVGEGAEGVGAEQEVVLHEHEVPRQPLRPPHQLHHRPRLPPHPHAGDPDVVLWIIDAVVCGNFGLLEAEVASVRSALYPPPHVVEERVLARKVVKDDNKDSAVERVIWSGRKLFGDGVDGLVEVIRIASSRDSGNADG